MTKKQKTSEDEKLFDRVYRLFGSWSPGGRYRREPDGSLTLVLDASLLATRADAAEVVARLNSKPLPGGVARVVLSQAETSHAND